ncbi:MAG: 4-alpha-glucanotransferase [Desulfuromonadales bacterium]
MISCGIIRPRGERFMQRASGILLHPTALPGPGPIGDFGPEAFAFVDFLAAAGQSVWQILPLGPTGYGHSPYNALSAFAGNPALIDLRQLIDCGDLDSSRTGRLYATGEATDFDQGHRFKQRLLQDAAQNFWSRQRSSRHDEFVAFCAAKADWLEDFSLYMALKETFAEQAWHQWPQGLRRRDPEELTGWRARLADECRVHAYQQFVFEGQWQTLKNYANRHGVQIFGDLPIFVAYDSAEVWANQHLFRLDAEGRPLVVAGVPPDYFSRTGQRWGNPLYCWSAHQQDGFSWWLRRFAQKLQRCDLIRVDHFRGFQACWVIPATESTAINGHWEETPGDQLFATLQQKWPTLPIVAEDLGLITAEVTALRDRFNLPGMCVLQFAFDGSPDNPYLPENQIQNSVIYTGTHDNDTTLGWWRSLSPKDRRRVSAYLDEDTPDMPWALMRLALSSVADLCILPCQDILECDSAARFNMPGRATGNWQWRLHEGLLTQSLAERVRVLTETYQRVPDGKT